MAPETHTALTLAPSLVAFLLSIERLGERCVSYEWGAVTADSRFLDVHDANHVLVAGERTPTAAVLAEALRLQRQMAALSFEQIEVVDAVTHSALVDELTERYGDPLQFSVMAAVASRTTNDSDARRLPTPDEPSWLELKRAAHTGEDLEERLLRQLARYELDVFFPAGRMLFGIVHEGRMVSAATLHVLDQVALIDDVVTVPELRRRGLASRVVKATAAAAEQHGAHDVLLFTDAQGPARRLYERLGFRQVAVSAQFHRDLP